MLTLLKKKHKSSQRRGSALVELSLAVTLLLFVSLWVFRTNLQTIRPRNWAIVQTITDAYMTEHLAFSEAIDFDELVDPTSPWPVAPDSISQQVTIGTLPGGQIISGTLVRTREPDANNLIANGGSGDSNSNPARVESWHVQNHLTYNIGGRSYVKSRTTVRTR